MKIQKYLVLAVLEIWGSTVMSLLQQCYDKTGQIDEFYVFGSVRR